MGGIGAVVGEEGRLEEVPNAPKEDVVGEGIGLSHWPDGTHNARVLPVAGHAQEFLDETDGRNVVHTCPAVDGNEESQLVHVVDGVEVGGVDFGLVPFCVPAVVAVLDEVGTVVDGIDDLFGGAARPAPKFGG